MDIQPALAVDLLLAPQSGLPKLAILLFYLRISPSRNFHICTWIVIAITWGFMISIFCAILFSCNPVHKLWDVTVPGTCLPALSIINSTPIIGTAIDIMILILPIPMLIKLRVNLRTKLVVLAIFSAFFCTTIISATRIALNAKLFGDFDITWDASLPGDLTVVENNMMVVCSSVLVLRPFCRRYFPSLFGKDSKLSDEELSPEGKNSGGQLNYDGPNGPNSKSDYRTKVRGGKAKSKSRNLWSLSFANTTKAHDEDDIESFDTEHKRLSPTGEDAPQNPEGLSTPHGTSRDGQSLHSGVAPTSHANDNIPQVPASTWQSREQDGDIESGIMKTVSLDVRGRAS